MKLFSYLNQAPIRNQLGMIQKILCNVKVNIIMIVSITKLQQGQYTLHEVSPPIYIL